VRRYCKSIYYIRTACNSEYLDTTGGALGRVLFERSNAGVQTGKMPYYIVA